MTQRHIYNPHVPLQTPILTSSNALSNSKCGSKHTHAKALAAVKLTVCALKRKEQAYGMCA